MFWRINGRRLEYAGTNGRPNEDQAIIWRSVGTCELYLGHNKQAIETLEEADRFFGDVVRIKMPLAEACLKVGQIDKAKNYLRESLKVNPNHAATLYWLGVILEQEGKPDAEKYYRDALAAGEKGLKINSDNGSDHFLLYQIFSKLGEKDRAEVYRKQAADLHFTFEAPWPHE